MIVDPLSGEVTVALAGTVYRFRATLPRLAAFQAALGVNGLGAVYALMKMQDARAIYHGLRCLCTSGNEGKLDEAPAAAILKDNPVAVISAVLAAGLPPMEGGDRGNAEAPTTKKPRGRATGKSPSASSNGPPSGSRSRRSASSTTP
jgi:hypothetical protein